MRPWRAGGADARLVSVLDDLTKEHQLRIGTLQVSHGAGGDSFDILSVDGERVSQSNIYARDLANELASLDPSLRPAQVVTPWPIEARRLHAGRGHDDRIHISFDAPSSSSRARDAHGRRDERPRRHLDEPGTGTSPPEPSATTPPRRSDAATGPTTRRLADDAAAGSDHHPARRADDTAARSRPPPRAEARRHRSPAPPRRPRRRRRRPIPRPPRRAARRAAAAGAHHHTAGRADDTSADARAAARAAGQLDAARPTRPLLRPGERLRPAARLPIRRPRRPPEPRRRRRSRAPPRPRRRPPRRRHRRAHRAVSHRPGGTPPEPATTPPCRADHPSARAGVPGRDAGRPAASADTSERRARRGPGPRGPLDLPVRGARRRPRRRRGGVGAPGHRPECGGRATRTRATRIPGDNASQQAIAAWMARQAHKAGLPAELPIMAALTESGLKNDNYGDRDSLGFFQMRTSIWNQGEYKGFPDHPELQLKWFINQALEVRRERLSQGDASYGQDKSKWGDWVADVEQPAAEYRGRYQTHLDQADSLLSAGRAGRGRRRRDGGARRGGRGRGPPGRDRRRRAARPRASRRSRSPSATSARRITGAATRRRRDSTARGSSSTATPSSGSMSPASRPTSSTSASTSRT